MPLAAARAGLIHVPVNPLLKGPQVAHILADSGAKLLITNGARADMLGEGLPDECAVQDLKVAEEVIDSGGQGLPPSIAEPDDLAAIASGAFTVGVALETLEHVRPEHLDRYLSELRRIVAERVLITVPNEIGLVFLLKFLGKAVLGTQTRRYGAADVLWQTLGRTHRVVRADHTGFNHRIFLKAMRRHFTIDKVVGLPLEGLPTGLAFTIAILARPAAH